MQEVPRQGSSYRLAGNSKDEEKTREQLVIELDQLRRVVGRFETLSSSRRLLETNQKDKSSSLLLPTLDQTSEGIAAVDIEGNLLTLNKAFASMHGYTPEELIGKHLSIFHTPNQMPAVEAANRQILKTGEFRGEIWHMHHDGTVFPCIMNNSILRDNNGDPIGMVGTIRDITKRKKAEEALKESEAKWRSLAENAPVMITHIDREGLIQSINHIPPEIGMTDNEILGKNSIDFAASEFRDTIRQIYDRVLETGITESYEMKGALTGKWYYSTFGPIKHNGTITGLTVINDDITDRKRVEENLIKRNKELGALHAISETIARSSTMDESLNNTLDKILELLDIENGCIHLLDKAEKLNMDFYRGMNRSTAERFSPLKMGEWTVGRVAQSGEAIYIKSLPAILETLNDEVQEYVTNRKLESGMFVPLRTKTGVWGVMSAYTEENHTFTKEDQKLLITIGHQIGTAIENANLMEDASRTKALEELDKMRTALLANVSHELRTPLTCIKGLASSLIQPDIKWDDETSKDFLITIDQEADRLTHIISDLLDMSQLESGRMKLYKTETTIASIVDQISEQLKRHTVNHSFCVCIPPEMPTIYVDEIRIGEVISNLIANASAYSTEGTQITLEANQTNGEVVISVTDKGFGIPEEYLEKVFSRFLRLEIGAQKRKAGTGLGLSICQGIVKKHSGKIWVESQAGKGSKFSFSLPIGENPAV